jgi:hypothetical protein
VTVGPWKRKVKPIGKKRMNYRASPQASVVGLEQAGASANPGAAGVRAFAALPVAAIELLA